MNLTQCRRWLVGIATAVVGGVVQAQDAERALVVSGEPEIIVTRTSKTFERMREWAWAERDDSVAMGSAYGDEGAASLSRFEGGDRSPQFMEDKERADVLILEKFEVWDKRPVVIPRVESGVSRYINTGIVAEKVGERTTRRLTFTKHGGLRLTFSR